jgi:hypothetical protein
MSSGSGRDKVGITCPLLRPGLAQMQRSRQSREAAADDDDIGLSRANEFGQIGTGRRHRRPQRSGRTDMGAIHHQPSFADLRAWHALEWVGLRPSDRSV